MTEQAGELPVGQGLRAMRERTLISPWHSRRCYECLNHNEVNNWVWILLRIDMHNREDAWKRGSSPRRADFTLGNPA